MDTTEVVEQDGSIVVKLPGAPQSIGHTGRKPWGWNSHGQSDQHPSHTDTVQDIETSLVMYDGTIDLSCMARPPGQSSYVVPAHHWGADAASPVPTYYYRCKPW